jgi:hypothetical protein
VRRSELEELYRQAIYRVRLETGTLDLRIGVAARELDHWLLQRGAARWGLVTAVNPGSVRLGEAENGRRLARLEALLRRGGRELRPAEGLDPEGRWPPEPSFLVVGLPEAETLALAAAFGQAACVAGDLGSPPRLVFVAASGRGALRRRPRARSDADR